VVEQPAIDVTKEPNPKRKTQRSANSLPAPLLLLFICLDALLGEKSAPFAFPPTPDGAFFDPFTCDGDSLGDMLWAL
jgi:hypothetical protein